MAGRLPALRREDAGVGVSAAQMYSMHDLDVRVAQAISQLNKMDCGDLAAAVLAALTRPQRIEVLMVRDPDHATEVELFVDGRPISETPKISVAEFDVDPGTGYVWADWVESRAGDIAAASPLAATALRRAALRTWDFIEEMPDSRGDREKELDAAVAEADRQMRGRFQPGMRVRQQLRCTCCYRCGTVAGFQAATEIYQSGWWVDWIGGGRTLEPAGELTEVSP